MKKSIKRTLSLLLALTMVLSLGLPAYAVGVPEDDIAITEEPAVKTANLPIGAGKQPGIISEDEIISDDLIVDIVDEETVDEETAAPAKDFSYNESATGFSVEVSAPVGALPLGTEMVVDRLVDLSDVQAAVDSADNLDGEVQLAADISFWHEGKEIEPAEGSKLLVRMSAPEIAGIADPIVIHVPDGENAVPEIVEQMSADDDLVLVNAVEFEAEDFSVYAVIGEVIIEDEEGTIDFESEDYTVTVSYTKEAKIPAGTKLTVSEIPFLSEEYAELFAAAQEKLNENAVFGGAEDDPDTRRGIADAIFVDVSLEYNGKPFEPAVPLDVKITLKNAALFCPAGEEALVVHFGNKGTELIEDVALGAAPLTVPDGMPEGLMLNSFEYEQNGFSAVGLISTDKFIDFEKAAQVNAYQPIHPVKDTPVISAGKTVTDTDKDGISELALTVTGQADTSTTTNVEKANVILVIDVSGSMDEDVYSEYEYNEKTYNSSATYVTSNGYRVAYNTSGGYWYYSNYPSYTYDGQVYLYETRLDATKRAACNLVDVLLENNNKDNPDAMEISVIKFARKNESNQSNGTRVLISKSTSASDLKTQINNLRALGATNWQAALELAKTEADNVYKPQTGEKTSVIFLTDGLPTRYGNDSGSGQEDTSNVPTCFNNAKPAARAIIGTANAPTGYTLYSIFAFGDADGTGSNDMNGARTLNNLTHYAYTGANNINWNTNGIATNEHYFTAQNTEDLEEAFQAIAHSIQNAVGFAGVSVTDGVSLGATNTSLAVNGTVDSSSFRYSVSKNAVLYDVHIENGTATFTIYGDGEPTVLTDTSPDEVTTTINGKEIKTLVYSVTVGTGADAKTYKMSPATIDENGLVKWDLSGLGILEDGVTYKLAFDVWPNQVAYDIAADLNNKIYNSVDEALAAYVAKGLVKEADVDRIKNALKNDSGKYYVLTNYRQEVKFYPAESHTDEDGNVTWEYGEPVTQGLKEPPAIELKGSSLPLTKEWMASLSENEVNELLWKDGVVNGTSTEYGITLHVWKADTEAALIEQYSNPEDNDPYQSYTLGWDKDQNEYVWSKAMAVAPGMMLNKEKAKQLGFNTDDTTKIVTYGSEEYYVVENGHYYYVTEDASDLHFELNTHIYHPMIVDGKLVDLTLDDSGKLVEQMVDMSAVTATNTLKGGLNISKVVTGEDKTTEVKDPETGLKTCEDEFTFKITIWKEDEEGNKTPVYTTDDQIDTSEATPKTISGSVGYRIFAKPTGFDDKGNIKYDEQKRGAVLAENSEYADLTNGVFAEITSTETTITLTMPANGEIRLVNLPAGTHYKVEEILDSANTSYQHFKTVHGVKTGSGITEDEPVTNIEVSGEVHGNMAAVETFYNWAASFYVYHAADNTIEKISFADNRVKGEYDEKNGYTYTFNIAKETKDHYIYGGYYKDFADKGTFDVTKDTFTKKTEAVATTYDGEHKDGYWFTVTEGSPAPYRGDASKWSRAQAYTENGTAMEPKANKVYFLREVPDEYMRGALRYTYYKNTDENIGTVWLVTAIDDEAGDSKGYKEFGLQIGFEFNADPTKITSKSTAAGSTAASLRIETRTNSNVFRTYTAGSLLSPINSDFAEAKGFVGYIMIRDVSIYGNGSMPESLVENNQKTAMYWVTPDDVQVTGVRVSSVDHIGGTASTIKLSKFGKYEKAEKDITSTLIYVGD